ncbi:MAG: hypothetical protein WDO68_23540 [Gammaproteobacteria bacterium]
MTILLGGLLATGLATAASPGFFTESANTALFEMPNRVTPDPMDLNYPLLCVDANANGREEIISGGSLDAIWRTLEMNPDGQSFAVTASARRPFPTTSSGANQGRVLFMDTASTPGQPKLYAQIIDGSANFAARYDVRSHALEAVADLTATPIGIRDLDHDGTGELIAFWSESGTSRIDVYDLQMSKLLASYPVKAGIVPAVALGNFDDDAQWEIATSAGIVYEITLDGIREDGSFADITDGNWIEFMTAADVDADGKDEIVAAYWSRVTVIDHDMRAVKWSASASVNSSAQLNVLKAIDLVGNPTPEVVIGQVGHPAAAGNFVIFDGTTGTELRTIEHPDVGVFGLNACDVDGDGAREMIAGLTRPEVGPDRLYVYDPATGLLKWRSTDEAGLLRAATMADADDDGRDEIAFAPYQVFGVGDLRLHGYDAGTFSHRWTTASPMLPQLGADSLNSLAVGDADGDGDTDIVVGSSQNGTGRIWIVDGRTRTLAKAIQVGGLGTQVRAVTLANLAGDGGLEIAAGTSNGVLEVIRGTDGGMAWQASWGGSEARELKTADFNADGVTDVLLRVAPESTSEVFIVDGASRSVRPLNQTCAASILPFGAAGTSTPEVVIGGCDGTLRVVDPVSSSVLQNRSVCAAPVNAIARSNLHNAGTEDLLFACGERIGWISLATGEFRFITAVVGDQIGLGNNLFSGRTPAGSDYIAVSTAEGIAQLLPSASLAAYVSPFNPTTTNIYSIQSGSTLNESMRFGAFDTSNVTLEVVSQPRHGRLTITNAQTGQFRYESDSTFTGMDLLVVRARTAQSTSAPTTIPIAVTARDPNLPPPPSGSNPSSDGGGGGGGGAMDLSVVAMFCLLLLWRLGTTFRRGSPHAHCSEDVEPGAIRGRGIHIPTTCGRSG